MKLTIIAIILIIIVALGVLLFSPKPSNNLDSAKVIDRASNNNEEMNTDEKNNNEEEKNGNLPVNVPNSAVNFNFIGYGPGKSHIGTFEEYEISNVIVNPEGIPISGKIAFDSKSVKTDSGVLDGHLCGENFFNCDNYKEIVFEIKNIATEDNLNYNVSGELNFKGNLKTINFPVKVEEKIATANFKINMKEIGFSGPGVNEEVEIKFTVKL